MTNETFLKENDLEKNSVEEIDLDEIDLDAWEEDELLALLASEEETGSAMEASAELHPISSAQQRLWFVDRMEGAKVTYNFPLALHVTGSFEPALWQQAMAYMVQRHHILTATFCEVDGQPMQRFDANHQVQMSELSLEALSPEAQQAKLDILYGEEANFVFDLAAGPLYRLSIVKLADEHFVLLLNMHHIITDGWSGTIFAGEMTAAYSMLAHGVEVNLPPLPIQYSDYVYWQNEYLQGEEVHAMRQYWSSQLAGLTTLNLPLDRPRGNGLAAGGGKVVVNIPVQLKQRLEALTNEAGGSMYMLLLAVYKVVLFAHCKQTDITVGTSVACRELPELEQLIGLFVNQLVLRTQLSGNPTFSDVLQRVIKTTTDAYANQKLPFNILVSEIAYERNPHTSPLFQTLFLYNNFPKNPADPNSPIKFEPHEINIDASRFDLTLTVEDKDAQLEAAFGFRTDLFDQSTIATLSQHYLTLLNKIVQQPEQVLSKLLADLKLSERAKMETKPASSRPSRFKRRARKSVSLSTSDIVNIDESDYPTVIAANSDNVVLPEWIESNRDMLEQKLMNSGAILFRGFGINTPKKFEQTAIAVCPELFGQYGDLPKETKGEKIYKSTPYPNDKTILFHNESSHTQQFPLRQMFGSMIVAHTGGETPIVDCRKVYNTLPEEIIQKLTDKKLQYVRNFIEGLDVPWQQFFKTEEKADVEAYCQANDIEFEWINDKELRTKQIRDAINTHVITGEKTFFNQIQLHHISYMDEKERESLLTMYSKERLPRNVYYGDGSDIEDDVIELINKAYDDNAVAKLWQEGDFMLVDNMLTAHGRLPFEGERKIVVALGRIMQVKDLL